MSSTRRRRNPRSYETLSQEESESTGAPERKKQKSLTNNKKNSHDTVDTTPPSQISFSQDEDERIRSLQKSGALSDVVGPESMLSQELQEMSQRTFIYEHVPVHASSLLSQDTTQLSSQDSSTAPTASNDIAENISSSQLSCLVRAAQELESPLPSPQKTTTNAGATYATQDSYEQAPAVASYPLETEYFKFTNNTTNIPPLYNNNTTLPPPRDSTVVQLPHYALEPRKAKQAALVQKNHGKKSRKMTKSRAEKEREQTQARQLAQQAAQLAAQAIADPEISKQLLLSMVFVRTNPRSPPASWPPRGSIIEEGFFWGTYPPLETKLKSYMRAYYDLSVKKCQSKEQQAFNNDMVVMIRAEAAKYEWSFSTNFSEKGLRDRVRCYFKTHIQNAKKRLRSEFGVMMCFVSCKTSSYVSFSYTIQQCL